MQLRIAFLLFFLFVLFSPVVQSEVYVYFVNGASNSTKDGLDSSLINFRKTLVDNGLVSKDKISYRGIYISGGLTDAHEILFQQQMSSKSISYTGADLSDSWGFSRDVYIFDLGESYYEQKDKGFPIFGGAIDYSKKLAADIVISTTEDISNKLFSALSNGHKIVIVPHSQGNLYVEGALASMYRKYGRQIISDNVRVVNLASVSALSYNSSWITLSQDQAINGLKYGVLVRDNIFKPTSSNIDGCLSPCDRVATVTEMKIGERTDAHGFNEIYTNKDIYSFQHKINLPSLLVQHVQEAIDILEAPIVTSVSPLVVTVGEETVFTVEGSNLSSGMGFAVNDCSPSSVEVAGGTSTKRQFKCTMGQSIGEKNGVIKNRPGGVTAFEFKVQAVLSQVGTWESTLTADGITVKNIFYKNLSALPNGKTVFSGKHSIKYGVSCDLGQDLEITIDRNEKSFGITTVTKSDRTECQEGNVRVYTTGLGVITTRSGELENGVIILNPWNGCDSTINDVCYSYDSIKPK